MKTETLIIQFILAGVFILSGVAIVYFSKGKLPVQFTFKEGFSDRSFKLFGLSNLIAALVMFGSALSFN